MSRHLGYPYPTLFPVVSGPARWEALIQGEPRAFRDGSRSWDYQSELEIICSLGWHPQRAFDYAGIQELWDGARLAIIISTGFTDSEGRRFAPFDQPIRSCTGEGHEISLSLSSAELCSRLVATLLIYTTGGSVAGIGIRSHSVLYREQAILPLEGDLASFPVRTISFSRSGLADGFWLVDVRPTDLWDPILSTVTLLLNGDHPELIDRLMNSRQPDLLLRWNQRADIAATVLSTVLLRDELGYDLREEYPGGSLGSLVASLLRGLGISSDGELTRLRDEAAREPGRFRQRCQVITMRSEGAG